MSETRVGILTFHRSVNYGSALQVYALARTLQRMGVRVEVIDYTPPVQARMYGIFEEVASWRSVAKNARSAMIYPLLKKRQERFERFVEQRLPLSSRRYEIDDFESLSEQYDVVICGSDQIWNVGAADFTEAYLLPFVHSVKKIAYAPSMNRGDFLGSDSAEHYRSLLLDFDALSVRELGGKEKLDRLLGGHMDVSVVADPTLLLSQREYDEICPPRLVEDGYLFMYTVNSDRSVIDATRLLSAQTRLPVYTLFTGNRSYHVLAASRGRIRFSTHCGPEDFLSLVKHAELVVTNSFHGTVFAALFRREFFSVASVDSDGTAVIDTRIVQVLSVLGLSDRNVTVSDIDGQAASERIDYASVEELRKRYISSSMAYLEKALFS